MQANYLCDCLAQSLYSRLVQHINRKINQTMEARSSPNTTHPSLNRTKAHPTLSSPRGANSTYSIHIVDSLAFQADQVNMI